MLSFLGSVVSFVFDLLGCAHSLLSLFADADDGGTFSPGFVSRDVTDLTVPGSAYSRDGRFLVD